LVDDSKSASKFGYGLMLIGLFVQIFFGTPVLINFMYSSDPTTLLWFFSRVLRLIPSF